MSKLAASPFRFAAAARALGLALAALSAVGCEDEAEIGSAPLPVETAKPAALPRMTWLGLHDAVTPERWLASREANADLAEDDPKVIALRAELAAAAQRFRDPPRMIANRAVQLEAMLAAIGVAEHAPELIALLSSAAGAVRPQEGFGAICQHYYNLRKQGLDRDTALAQLKETSLLDVSSRRDG